MLVYSLLLTTGCDGTEKPPGDDTAAVDVDGDGVSAGDGDCDDGDASVYPGAEEACDDVDQNCDGEIDEGATRTFYVDADADGYGDPLSTRGGCTAPEGTVRNDEDCDDADPDRHPGATEVCDGFDDDCDGNVDDDAVGDPLTWYADGDGDGFGDAENAVVVCIAPDGTVADATDCDDTNAAINPDAAETCDLADDDCDGDIDEDAPDAPTWYPDDDGDGYGATDAALVACTAPEGWIADGEDCDDDLSSVNPLATDTCYDAVDQDCNGTVDDGCSPYVEHCGTIAVDETWDASSVHLVTCDVSVQGAAAPTLTIEDGAMVILGAGVRIAVGDRDFGALTVAGSVSGVTFTSEQAAPAPGDWDGLYIGRYAREVSITRATVAYAGGNGMGAIHAEDSDLAAGSVTVTDSVVVYSSASGIYGEGESTLDISGTTLQDNAEDGLHLDEDAGLVALSFVDNVVTGNGLYPAVVPVGSVAALDPSSAFTGNAVDSVYVHGGTLAEDATWLALDAPYVVAGDVSVAGAAAPTLTIADGVTLTFNAGKGLAVGDSSYGSLSVEGGSTGVLFTSSAAVPAPGDWDGLYVGSYGRDVDITGATVEYGGGNGKGEIQVYYSNRDGHVPVVTDSVLRYGSNSGVWVGNQSTASLIGNTITDNADYGVYVDSDSALDTFTGNTMSGNGLTPVTLPANSVGALDGSSAYTGNGSDYVEIMADTVADDATWSLLDVDYVVAGEVYVQGAGDPQVTIADGTTFWFDAGVGLRAGYSSYGAIHVEGGATGVLFTSSDTASPGAGDWDGLWLGNFDTGSELSGATIEYGGANGHADLYVDDNAGYGPGAAVVGCTVRSSSTDGIALESGAVVEISDTTISGNADYGVSADDTSTLSSTNAPAFLRNVVTGNGSAPVSLHAAYAYALDDTSTYVGNAADHVNVAGDTIATDANWEALDVPWYIASDVTVQAVGGVNLTIAAGATLEFAHGAGLTIGNTAAGALYADGTATDPILFTSGQGVATAGDWDGVTFGTNDAGSTLRNATVEYGGGNGKGNLYFNSASDATEVDTCTIAYSSTWGIYRNATTPVLTSVTYTGNAAGDLH